ncbi:uncharacterized protein LOC127287895 [Leptopilina boulardi]|uniref:uncharacterized protein LOC127287895 n=1 Tax=Leptopilina boulardi TaxID=63433 RepID=UPI0021F509EC|nr:uncharacterized protein LOC127287895 [Leptopilina boulardi]
MKTGFINSSKLFKKRIIQKVKKRTAFLESTIAKNAGKMALTDLRTHLEALEVNLPISNVEEFNKAIAANVEKIKSLKTVMTVQARQSSTSKEAMMKILSGIMKKSVQEKYSACGKGHDNKSFKNTFIYATMRDVILDSYKDAHESQILTDLSTWLSSAGDREGGRKTRKAVAEPPAK